MKIIYKDATKLLGELQDLQLKQGMLMTQAYQKKRVYQKKKTAENFKSVDSATEAALVTCDEIVEIITKLTNMCSGLSFTCAFDIHNMKKLKKKIKKSKNKLI